VASGWACLGKTRLMTEACEVVTEYWFSTPKFPVLRVPKAVANMASRRISEKEGMRVVAVEERDYVCGRLSTEVWEIAAEEWRARQPKWPVAESEFVRTQEMILILLVILLVLALGTAPVYPYSRGWGYYPSGTLGTILLIILILYLLHYV